MGTTVRVAVATGGSTMSNYSMTVFTGWDYGCLGNQATKLKQRNIYYRLQVGKDPLNLTYWDLFLSDANRFAFTFFFPSFVFRLRQVDLEEERIKKQAASLTPWKKVALYSLRVLMFFISFGLIIAAFFGISVATKFSQVQTFIYMIV